MSLPRKKGIKMGNLEIHPHLWRWKLTPKTTQEDLEATLESVSDPCHTVLGLRLSDPNPRAQGGRAKGMGLKKNRTKSSGPKTTRRQGPDKTRLLSGVGGWVFKYVPEASLLFIEPTGLEPKWRQVSSMT